MSLRVKLTSPFPYRRPTAAHYIRVASMVGELVKEVIARGVQPEVAATIILGNREVVANEVQHALHIAVIALLHFCRGYTAIATPFAADGSSVSSASVHLKSG